MNRDTAIAKLKENADAVRALGATALYLYGSTARDEATADSDVDVFIEYDEGKRFSLLDLVGIQQELEERLATKVDVSIRKGIRPEFRKFAESDAIRIF
ncbi:MAG: nucleotidyltransferase domain-containing protein [Bauldia sp.]